MKAKMVKSTKAVIEKQHEINGSLSDLEARRRERGRGNDPLQPVDLRTAAYVLAISRVADVTLERGIWP